MKLAHLADPHLGFRQYHRQTAAGLNQREADVAEAFRRAIDGVIAEAPDAVVIAGDLFHAVRPTNKAIVFAFRQLQRLVAALPGAPVVLVAGNHDTPRSSETGSILRLFADIGIAVAVDRAERFEFPERSLSILAVPHPALETAPRPALEPLGGARHQVLVLHGEAQGLFPHHSAVLEHGGAVVTPEEARPDAWSYTAWGHYHVQRPVGPRAWYAGALDYCSTDIWSERAEERSRGLAGKGWLLVDLETGVVSPRPVAPVRAVLDLPRVAGEGLGPAELGAKLAEAIAAVPGGLADKVVRLVVDDVPRHVARELDHARLREWRAAALHFQLDLRRPGERRRDAVAGEPGRRRTLPELLRAHLAARPLPAELDRERFVALGTGALDAVLQG
ncbi:MAG: DNA repair exonuclease [Gemmatimonadales bacterium]|nr:DNA repair exonuclease [Gemmatimonadales bacterium]